MFHKTASLRRYQLLALACGLLLPQGCIGWSTLFEGYQLLDETLAPFAFLLGWFDAVQGAIN